MKNKFYKIYYISLILLSICLIFTGFFYKKDDLKNLALEKYSQIKNNNFKSYLKINEKFILNNSCLDEDDFIDYYNNIYKLTINSIYELEKSNLITHKDRNIIFKYLKQGKIKSLYDKIIHLNVSQLSSGSLAKKNFILALISDLNLKDENITNQYFLNAIKFDKFNLDLYTNLSNFYKKSCKNNDAINILLKMRSIAANNNEKEIFYNIYIDLGNSYFAIKDYENALTYYLNALIYMDFNENNKGKFNVLVKIADIMHIKGNIFESVNYFKYALSLNAKITKKEKINVILKLSKAYYDYGNYENGLKFAKMATSLSGKDNLLLAKSKLNECLNYEYLRNNEKAKETCATSLNLAISSVQKNNNYDNNLYLGFLYNYPSYLRDRNLSEKYFNISMDLAKNNHLKKIETLEKLISLYIYGNKEDNLKALKIFENLNKLYIENNVNGDCCINIYKGYLDENLNKNNNNIYYTRAENDLKNFKAQLLTLYIYMAKFYKDNDNLQLAKSYAQKAVDLSYQVYKYDHHYINHAIKTLDEIVKLMSNKK